MSKGKQHEAGASEGARRATGEASVFCLVLWVHSRLHVEIMHLLSPRWPGGRSWLTEGAGSVHQRPDRYNARCGRCRAQGAGQFAVHWRRYIVKKTSIVGLLVVALGGVPSPAQGQGWYLGSELGGHVVPALGITGLSNDRASVCDEFINPQYATVTQTAGYEAYNCTGPDRRDNWVNQFARATGLQTSWVLGYRFEADASGPRWRHVRTEVEYFYRATAYDQTVAVPGLSAGSGSVTANKLNQELQTATDYLGRVTAHTLFANLYWDVRTRSRLTPYVGVGVGFGSTAVAYGSLWSRNANPTAITTGEGLPNVDAIRQNLAATTSSFQGVLSDRLLSQQVLVGVHYALTEDLAVGVKGRWVHGAAFESDDAVVWDPLRSHVPNLRRDGSEPVSGQLLTDASTLWDVGLSLTYHF